MDVNDFGKKRKKTIFFSSAFIVALVLIVGLSYSFFVKSKKQEQGNVIATSCFDIDLVGQNPINLASAYPISEEDGMNTIPYTFTITNICDNKINYDINLESLVTTTFNSDSIMTAIDTNIKLYSSYEKGTNYFENSKDARHLTSGFLNKGDSKTFNLRLWIDKNASSTEQNKIFESKIIVYANLDYQSSM